MLTRKRPVNRTVSNVAYAEEKELDPAKCEDLMRRAEKGLDEAAVLNRLRKPFAVADFMFLSISWSWIPGRDKWERNTKAEL